MRGLLWYMDIDRHSRPVFTTIERPCYWEDCHNKQAGAHAYVAGSKSRDSLIVTQATKK